MKGCSKWRTDVGKKDSILAELLNLIGSEDLPETTTDEINEILQRGVPIALKEQLSLIVGAGQERNKAWMIKEWLDRAGYAGVQKIAVAKKIQLDEKTLAVLSKIAGEDDPDSKLCEEVITIEATGSGGDTPQLEAEMQGVPLLPEQGGPRLSGLDADIPPQDVQVRTRSDNSTPSGGTSSGSSQEYSLQPRQADPPADSGTGST